MNTRYTTRIIVPALLLTLVGTAGTAAAGPASDALDAAEAASCASTPVAASRSACATLHGDAGISGSPALSGWCRSEPHVSASLVGWAAWYAVQAHDQRTLFTPREQVVGIAWPLVGTPVEGATFGEPGGATVRVCADHWAALEAVAAQVDGR